MWVILGLLPKLSLNIKEEKPCVEHQITSHLKYWTVFFFTNKIDLNGHSFEVDIWSLGVIAYALAIGRPPFETSDVKTTYTKIKNCNYSYPDDANVSEWKKSFISKMLQRNPRHRATVEELLNDEFFTMTPFPKNLPISALACPPNGAFLKQYQLPVMMKKNSSDM